MDSFSRKCFGGHVTVAKGAHASTPACSPTRTYARTLPVPSDVLMFRVTPRGRSSTWTSVDYLCSCRLGPDDLHDRLGEKKGGQVARPHLSLGSPVDVGLNKKKINKKKE
jgi:hypothetical protein